MAPRNSVVLTGLFFACSIELEGYILRRQCSTILLKPMRQVWDRIKINYAQIY